MQLKLLTRADLALLLPSIGSVSSDSLAVSSIDSKATLTLRCSAEVLPSLIYTMVGDTGLGYSKTNANFGKVARVPPMAHPYFPWLYCTGVTDVTGQAYTSAQMFQHRNEEGGKVTADNLQQTTYPLWPMYREYVVKASFSQMPYTVSTDNSIGKSTDIEDFTVDYYSQRNTSNTPNRPSIPTFNEWTRFCVLSYEIEGQFLTAEQGQYVMVSQTPMNEISAGKGNIRQLRSGAKVTYTWYGIPYEWLTGPDEPGPDTVPRGFSILDLAQGHVNQQYFDGFEAGTLLYTGAKTVRVYNRVFPTITRYNTLAPNRLCDLALEFIFRDPRRQGLDVATLKNYGSFITRGNNLVPNARDGYWYMAAYVSSLSNGDMISDTHGAIPIYPSIPFQFLFQDPAYVWSKIGRLLV